LISIWPRALLQRDWRIAAIFFDQPRLTVTRSANGGWSIPTPELNADVSLRQFGFRNAVAVVNDPLNGVFEQVSIPFAMLGYHGLDQQLWLRGAVDWRGKHIEASLDLTTPGTLLANDWTWLDVSARSAEDTARLTARYRPGGIGGWPIVQADLTASFADPNDFLGTVLGSRNWPDIPDLSDPALSLRLEAMPERFRLRSAISGTYLGTPVSGSALFRAPAGWAAGADGETDIVARAAGLFSAQLKGSYTQSGSIDGAFTLSVLDNETFLDRVGAPDWAPRPAEKASRMTANVSGTQDEIRVEQIVFVLGKSLYNGAVRADFASASNATGIAIDFGEIDTRALGLSLGVPALAGAAGGQIKLSLPDADDPVKGTVSASVFDGELLGGQFRATEESGDSKTTRFDRLSVDLAITGNEIAINRLDIAAGDWRAEGEGRYDIVTGGILAAATDPDTSYAVSGSLRDFSVRRQERERPAPRASFAMSNPADERSASGPVERERLQEQLPDPAGSPRQPASNLAGGTNPPRSATVAIAETPATASQENDATLRAGEQPELSFALGTGDLATPQSDDDLRQSSGTERRSIAAAPIPIPARR
ncbi:MAG: hypothetical protein AAF334_06195, partial [Pseudomonadota bacterium]